MLDLLLPLLAGLGVGSMVVLLTLAVVLVVVDAVTPLPPSRVRFARPDDLTTRPR